jgi:acyl-CoA hydrolase
LDLEERARALIGIAHPDFREELERAARTHRLIGPTC